MCCAVYSRLMLPCDTGSDPNKLQINYLPQKKTRYCFVTYQLSSSHFSDLVLTISIMVQFIKTCELQQSCDGRWPSEIAMRWLRRNWRWPTPSHDRPSCRGAINVYANAKHNNRPCKWFRSRCSQHHVPCSSSVQ